MISTITNFKKQGRHYIIKNYHAEETIESRRGEKHEAALVQGISLCLVNQGSQV